MPLIRTQFNFNFLFHVNIIFILRFKVVCHLSDCSAFKNFGLVQGLTRTSSVDTEYKIQSDFLIPKFLNHLPVLYQRKLIYDRLHYFPNLILYSEIYLQQKLSHPSSFSFRTSFSVELYLIPPFSRNKGWHLLLNTLTKPFIYVLPFQIL